MIELQTITLAELKRDGVTAEVLEKLNISDRQILVVEYAKSAAKRYEKFMIAYKYSPKKKEAFNKLILNILK